MARKHGSPVLELHIAEDDYQRAAQSKSGGCLIADAIKRQYPHLSNPSVDMATIRVSDRKAGKRYTYLTPPNAQHLLLSFDQGWRQLADEVKLERAVKITPLIRSKPSAKHLVERAAQVNARKAELEAKVERGEELTAGEKRSLTTLGKSLAPERPSSYGPTEVKGRHQRETVVIGGKPIVQGAPHPNLLRGHDRHFGAKLADPGDAFREAVEEGVKAEIEKQAAAKPQSA